MQAICGLLRHNRLLQVTRSVDLGPGEYSNQERATMDAIVMAR